MSTNNNSGSSGRVGLSAVLFILFLVLKLTGNINWSWWWVTSPLWIPLGLVVGLGVIGFGIYGLLKLLTVKRRIKRRIKR